MVADLPEPRPLPRTESQAGSGPLLTLILAVGCPLFVAAAVIAEVVAAQFANSAPTGWEWLFPLAWVTPARVAFWLVVALAAAGFRWGLARLDMPQRPLPVVATVAPFVLFAAGIATGSSFTTWH